MDSESLNKILLEKLSDDEYKQLYHFIEEKKKGMKIVMLKGFIENLKYRLGKNHLEIHIVSLKSLYEEDLNKLLQETKW